MADESLETLDEADLGRDEGDLAEDDGVGMADDGQDDDDDEEGGDADGMSMVDGSRIDEHGVLYFSGVSSIDSVETLKERYHLRDIGHEAIWSLSTAKPGNGVDQIRDGSMDTYWQSDGSYPHLINIQFRELTSVSSVAFFLDFNLDESYTPKQLCVRAAGTTTHDLVDVQVVDLTSPVGWINIPLRPPIDPLDEMLELAGEPPLSQTLQLSRHAAHPLHHHQNRLLVGDSLAGGDKKGGGGVGRPLRAFFIQIVILSMHQNGRDTHVRQVKVFGPRQRDTTTMTKPSTKAQENNNRNQSTTLESSLHEFKKLDLMGFPTTVR